MKVPTDILDPHVTTHTPHEVSNTSRLTTDLHIITDTSSQTAKKGEEPKAQPHHDQLKEATFHRLPSKRWSVRHQNNHQRLCFFSLQIIHLLVKVDAIKWNQSGENCLIKKRLKLFSSICLPLIFYPSVKSFNFNLRFFRFNFNICKFNGFVRNRSTSKHRSQKKSSL